PRRRGTSERADDPGEQRIAVLRRRISNSARARTRQAKGQRTIRSSERLRNRRRLRHPDHPAGRLIALGLPSQSDAELSRVLAGDGTLSSAAPLARPGTRATAWPPAALRLPEQASTLRCRA